MYKALWNFFYTKENSEQYNFPFWQRQIDHHLPNDGAYWKHEQPYCGDNYRLSTIRYEVRPATPRNKGAYTANIS